jgi:hypothetical protein
MRHASALAVFRTTPADVDGRIAGTFPLDVEFNLCRSRPSDADNDLKFTYDFDDDGVLDTFGHCRAAHTFTTPSRARVCVSDRRPDGIVCRAYEVASDAAERETEHVLRLAMAPCSTWAQARNVTLEGSISPPVPAGTPYSITFVIDGDAGAGFGQTRGYFQNYGCVGPGTAGIPQWSTDVPDTSAMPNEHAPALSPQCAESTIVARTYIETAIPGLADRIRTGVTGFEVRGRRARIEGATTFTCP